MFTEKREVDMFMATSAPIVRYLVGGTLVEEERPKANTTKTL
jgi:hypothetical protein